MAAIGTEHITFLFKCCVLPRVKENPGQQYTTTMSYSIHQLQVSAEDLKVTHLAATSEVGLWEMWVICFPSFNVHLSGVGDSNTFTMSRRATAVNPLMPQLEEWAQDPLRSVVTWSPWQSRTWIRSLRVLSRECFWPQRWWSCFAELQLCKTETPWDLVLSLSPSAWGKCKAVDRMGLAGTEKQLSHVRVGREKDAGPVTSLAPWGDFYPWDQTPELRLANWSVGGYLYHWI